jgi:hypothetical protein
MKKSSYFVFTDLFAHFASAVVLACSSISDGIRPWPERRGLPVRPADLDIPGARNNRGNLPKEGTANRFHSTLEYYRSCGRIR